jgi:hypothetical protein
MIDGEGGSSMRLWLLILLLRATVVWESRKRISTRSLRTLVPLFSFVLTLPSSRLPSTIVLFVPLLA